jgi:hypothetical protein
MKRRSLNFARPTAIIAVCLLLLGGCQTTYDSDGGPAVLASTRVAGKDSEKAFAAVERVFSDAGFRLVRVEPDLRVFERRGTKVDSFKYGDWDGAGVMMRAKVSAEFVGDGVLLQCRVVAVRDYEQTFGTENPVWAGHHEEYQALMDQVRQRLVSR